MSSKGKPWLNNDGSMKTDSEIKILGQLWSQETWNKYLDATVDVPQRESTLRSGLSADFVTNEEAKKIFSGIAPETKNQYLLEAVDELPASQREIIKKIFFDNLTMAETARELDIGINRVVRGKERALKALKIAISCKVISLNIDKFLKNTIPNSRHYSEEEKSAVNQ